MVVVVLSIAHSKVFSGISEHILDMLHTLSLSDMETRSSHYRCSDVCEIESRKQITKTFACACMCICGPLAWMV